MEKYSVKLTCEEREYLLSFIKKGKASAYKLTHARILLEADEGEHQAIKKTDKEIAAQLHVGVKTVKRIRQRCVEEGLEQALCRRPHARTRPRIIKGAEEAHLIALCCSSPPEGRSRWTLKLLANQMIALEIVESVSPATVGRVLKKMN